MKSIRKNQGGFTLPEVLVASVLSLLVVSVLGVLFLSSTRSLQALANYSELDSGDRLTVDYLSRDLRQAMQVTAYTTNTLTLQDESGLPLVYSFDPVAGTLTRTTSSDSKVLLSGCTQLQFDLGQRNPVYGSYEVFPVASDPTTAKVVDVSWVCARRLDGSARNTEDVQTARIVIRKQS